MKKIISIISIIMLLGTTSHAQLGDWLKRKKEDLSQKAQGKADERINNTADKILSKTDSLQIGSGKHKNKKNKKLQTADTTYNLADTSSIQDLFPNEQYSTNSDDANTVKTVLQTNIRSIAGKEKVAQKLKEIDGIYEITINIKTGSLTIAHDMNDSVHDTIVKVINDLGYKITE